MRGGRDRAAHAASGAGATPHPSAFGCHLLPQGGEGRDEPATFVLPDPIPEEGPVDLYAHYDRTRRLTFGALILGLMAFWVVGMVRWAGGAFPEAGPMTVWSVLQTVPWGFCLGYGVLIVVRRRWVNVLLLAVGLVYYGWEVLPMRLGE